MHGVASPKGANIGDSTQEWYSEKKFPDEFGCKSKQLLPNSKTITGKSTKSIYPPPIFEMYGLQKTSEKLKENQINLWRDEENTFILKSAPLTASLK